ncbi:MAG: hypothetical protein HXY40_18465 [Chloroflexi bacterium]|nr:hypothetical protein [Chloroflexota bacterium]
MPNRKFPLPSGQTLDIEWRGLWRDVSLRLGEQVIGSVATQKEMKQGRAFTLPDGGKLEVKLEAHGDDFTLRVSHNGKPLSGVAPSGGIGLNVLSALVLLLGLAGAGGGALTQLGQLDLLTTLDWEGLALLAGGTVMSIVSGVSLAFNLRRRAY